MSIKDENQDWDKKGLNYKSLDAQNTIKSHWRHIRTRLYFTSASHLYTLLNVIKYGLKHVNPNQPSAEEAINDIRLENTLRLDFMSGIFFRVFENLTLADENDPGRFRLDIMVNNGSILFPDKISEIEDHCIPISLEDSYSKTLTLEDIDHFFITLLNMQYQPENASEEEPTQEEP